MLYFIDFKCSPSAVCVCLFYFFSQGLRISLLSKLRAIPCSRCRRIYFEFVRRRLAFRILIITNLNIIHTRKGLCLSRKMRLSLLWIYYIQVGDGNYSTMSNIRIGFVSNRIVSNYSVRSEISNIRTALTSNLPNNNQIIVMMCHNVRLKSCGLRR